MIKAVVSTMIICLIGITIIFPVESLILTNHNTIENFEQQEMLTVFANTKEKNTVEPAGLPPYIQTYDKHQQIIPYIGKENFFYGYVVNPPPTGPINLSSWMLLGSGIDPNFIAGADIDNYGHWYGIANTGGLYFISYDGEMILVANSFPMNGLCFDSTTQTWYGTGNHNLYTVDITTGQTMLIGADGLTTSLVGLACDNDGTIYGYDAVLSGMSSLYTLNKANGTATLIGPMGVGFCYAQDPAYDRDNDILYVAGYTQVGTSGLYTCDVSTGVVTFLGPFQNNLEIDGFAITWTSLPMNQPPIPPNITGPFIGRVGVPYNFTFFSSDPDGDNIFYQWDWGDGMVTEWLGPYASGEVLVISHAWNEPGTFTIIVKAKDSYGEESDPASCNIHIVELHISLALGIFTNATETEDLIILDTDLLLMVPSTSILYSDATLIIAKNYDIGFFVSTFFAGIFEGTIFSTQK